MEANRMQILYASQNALFLAIIGIIYSYTPFSILQELSVLGQVSAKNAQKNLTVKSYNTVKTGY